LASQASSVRGRGRPVSIPPETRREQILKVAEDLFKHSGYAATSILDIARQCEMSKRAIYEAFETKEDLFRALVADVESFPVHAIKTDVSLSARVQLEQMLTDIARYVLSERHITVTRLVIAESGQFPEIRQHYYKQGIDRCKVLLELQLASLVEQGRIKPVNVDRMADMLFGAVIAPQFIAAISYRQPADLDEVAVRIREAVERLIDER
jgi:AcrR family transcriptional regulator